MPSVSYIHGTESDEQRRLEAQHRILGGASFLPPLRPGMKVLDVGSGTGAVAREVSSKVAPGGVVGIDNQPEQIEKARALALNERRSNVEFRLGKADSLEFSDETFDLAYCRFLLEHVSEPVSVVREMARVVKAGGTIVACECHVECCSTSNPPIPDAFKGLDALYRFQKLKGGDPYVGEKLQRIFEEVGLDDVRSDILTIEIKSPEDIRGYVFGGSQMLKACEADLLREGLLTRDELDKAYREWDDFARAPGAVAWFKLCRVQGIRPKNSG